jgi:DNA (cytosine-5)-methyltransferase 1
MRERVIFNWNAQVDQMNFDENTTSALTCSQGAAVAFAQNTRDEVRLQGGDGQIVGATCSQGGTAVLSAPTFQVRRLTPTEYERLQGFPDGYTNIPWRGKPESPDGPRYKALGNSWAVPNVRWIGERINEELLKCNN